jgi:excinuclease ABC subunit C
MRDAASQTRFEQAAAIRDQVRALEVTLQAQRVVSRDFVDQDIIGLHREGLALEIVVMTIRQGKLVGSRAFSFGGQEFPDSELLSSFIGLLYDSPAASIPDELLLPLPIEDAELKSEWLSERRPGRRRVEVLVPQRGDRKRLSDLALKNAQVSFASRRNAREDVEIMLAKLQRKLRLTKLPRVIECYDISHIQGFAPVASMVVFVDGRPERSRYRTYRVRGAEGPGARRGNDDFASMYEVLSRRFRRAREGDAGWELPDLVVIDGGKGQLGMALAAARDVGIDVRPGQGLALVGLAKERDAELDGEGAGAGADSPEAVPGGATTVGATTVSVQAGGASVMESVADSANAVDPAPIADQTETVPGASASPVGDPAAAAAAAPATSSKGGGRRGAAKTWSAKDARRPDRIYLPHAKDAIPIRPSSAEMFVLQHLRDEAHRFAISFHRRRRSSLTLRSALADVPGIGPQRQRLLLRHFGSLKKIREAAIDELEAVPGMTSKSAAAVFRHLGAIGAGVGTSAATSDDAQKAGASPGEAEPAAANGASIIDSMFAQAQSDAESPGDAEEEALENAFADVEDDNSDREQAAGPSLPPEDDVL